MKERMGEKGIDKYAAELGKWTFRTNGPCLSIPAQGSQVSCFWVCDVSNLESETVHTPIYSNYNFLKVHCQK